MPKIDFCITVGIHNKWIHYYTGNITFQHRKTLNKEQFLPHSLGAGRTNRDTLFLFKGLIPESEVLLVEAGDFKTPVGTGRSRKGES